MIPVRTRIGFAEHGDYEHFGRRLFRDFVGHTSYVGLAAFSLTGRELSPEDAALLDDIAVAGHVPEPRVWPMKVARLAASSGRALTGYLAGIAVLDSDLLAGAAASFAAKLLAEAKVAIADAPDRSAALGAFVRSKDPWPTIGVQGGRGVDERVVALRGCVERRGVATREHWALSTELWALVEAEKNVRATIFDATAAVLLDLAFSIEEIHALATILLQPQFLAHAFDGAMHPAPSLARLPDEAVVYVGPAPRRR